MAAAIAATVLLPPMQAGADDIESLGADDASFEAEQRSLDLFGFPLLSRVAIVQRDAGGMSPLVQAEAIFRGLAVNQGTHETELLGAIVKEDPDSGRAYLNIPVPDKSTVRNALTIFAALLGKK